MKGEDARAEQVIKNVGARIAQLRHERGWTQLELAERLGIEVQSLQRIERGTNFTIRSLVKIAQAFDVAPEALFEKGAERKPRPGRPRKSDEG